LTELINYINRESNQKSIEEGVTHVLKFEEPVWIDVQNPSISDMKMMEKFFGLHPLTTEDIINLDTGEKWELFSEYMFVVFTGQVDDEVPPPPSITKLLPSSYQHHTSTETQLNILVFPDYVITIHDRPIKGLDLLMRRIETEFEFDIDKERASDPLYKFDIPRSNVKRPVTTLASLVPVFTKHDEDVTLPIPRIDSSSTLLQHDNNISVNSPAPEEENQNAQSPPKPSSDLAPPPSPTSSKRTHIPSSDWVLYAFLDAMVDMYIPFVDSLVLEVDNLDELVFLLSQQEQGDLLKRLGLSKRNVVTLRRLLLPKQKMTTYLASQPIKFLSHTVQLYLRDVLDHLQICLEKLEVARENLNQTHNNYLTKVQIEIAEASGRTDEFMNRITVIASLLGPLTLVSSIWGMNVKVPGQDDPSLKWFFGINCGMLVLALILVIFLRNKLISL
jgi:Mg2+ and Co2+ transporter CorA